MLRWPCEAMDTLKPALLYFTCERNKLPCIVNDFSGLFSSLQTRNREENRILTTSTDGLGEKPKGGTTDAPVAKANIFCSLDEPSSSMKQNRIIFLVLLIVQLESSISLKFKA